MVCVMCKYTSMTAGHTLLPLERNNKILILTDIPARVCANCGKPYMTGATAREVEALADKVFSGTAPSARVPGKHHILQASFES